MNTADNEQVFQYVVARLWEPKYETDDLCIYTYGHQIQKGTRSDAEEFLVYVMNMTKHEHEYAIYKVHFEKLAP